MDLGVVRYEIASDRYVLDPQYISIYTSARGGRKLAPPALLKLRSTAQDELGLGAEQAIIDYERARVGPKYVDKIDHVARRNSGAGYDIRSITQDDCDQIRPRFIEVKAVSSGSYRFYWSGNEVDVARDLAGWYYLYLLPVNSRGKFDLDGLKIIQNPVKIVIGEDSDWATESDGVVCYKRIAK